MKQIFKILLPEVPSAEVFLRGQIWIADKDLKIIFITNYSASNEILGVNNHCDKENIIYGYYGNQKNLNENYSNSLIIENFQYPKLSSLILNGVNKNTENYILILYDYNKMKTSETLGTDDWCFSTLQALIQKECGQVNITTENKEFSPGPPWLESSMFGKHAHNYMQLLKWLFNSLRTRRKVSE